jgi:hypothetical protein
MITTSATSQKMWKKEKKRKEKNTGVQQPFSFIGESSPKRKTQD